jgi:hypothetical protein
METDEHVTHWAKSKEEILGRLIQSPFFKVFPEVGDKRGTREPIATPQVCS